MTWEEALEIVVASTTHERYRELCADGHPQREAWRARMLALATGPPPVAAARVSYPPLPRQALNLAGAVGRTIAAAARGEAIKVTPEVHDARMATCRGCEFLDGQKNRCVKCGCSMAIKPWGAREACPIAKW